MKDNQIKPLTPARLVRMEEPYHFQRLRHRPGEFPRKPQPAIQPNQKLTLPTASRTRDYWELTQKQYLDRGRTFKLGRL